MHTDEQRLPPSTRILRGVPLFLALLFVAKQAPAQGEYRLHADSTLVVIPVTVTDASNHFVLNIERDRFSVFEDGVKQRVSQFADEDAPLSIGLLVDVSGSMGRKLELSKSAVAEFLKTMNPKDEAFLIEFSDRAEVALGFTPDRNAITDKMNSVQPGGLTALLDAVHLGLQEMKSAKNPRKAMLILSDGGDNNSRYSSAEIKEIVRQADVQIYSMGVFEPVLLPGLTAAEVSGPALLSEISEQTGGRVFPARSSSAPARHRQKNRSGTAERVHPRVCALKLHPRWKVQNGRSEVTSSRRLVTSKIALANGVLRACAVTGVYAANAPSDDLLPRCAEPEP